MRKLAFLALGTLFGAASFAQDPLECVDPDVRALVFPNGANMQLSISTSVPDELSAIEVPNEFSWIGSIERNLEATPGVLHAFGAAPVAVWNLESGLVASPPLGAAFVASPIASVTAAYRTNLPPNAARDLALKALENDGWQVQSSRAQLGRGVFVTGASMFPETACRDGEAVTLTVNAIDGTTYAVYGFSKGSNRAACDPALQPRVLAAGDMREHLPTLTLPHDPLTGAPPQVRNSSGSGAMAEHTARVEFVLNDSVGHVASFLSQQLAEQGWTPDASWSGTTTAGSSWVLQTRSDTTLRSTLQVVAVDDALFKAFFHVIRTE